MAVKAGPGGPRRVLVVATAPDPADELLERLRSDAGGDSEIMVVAPATDLSFLQWVTSDEDRARAEAERRARELAEAEPIAGRVVEARVGDVDPLVAIEDALRTFPADELVVLTRPEEAATWLEEDAVRAALEQQFGLPVTHLVDDDVPHDSFTGSDPVKGSTAALELARGRSPWTPFLALNAVFVIVATVAALLIGLAFGLYFGLR